MSLFSRILERFIFSEIVGNSDEFLVVISFFIIFIKNIKNKYIDKFSTLLIFSLLYFVCISYLFGRKANIDVLLQSIIHLKLFFFFALVYWSISSRNIMRIILYIGYLSLIGAIINLIFISSFNNYFDLEISERSSFVRIVGFQLNSNNLGTTLSFFGLLIVWGRIKIKNYRVILLSLIVIFLFLTGSRTAFLIFILGVVFYLLSKKKPIYKFAIICLSFVMVIFIVPVMESDIFQKTKNNYISSTVNVMDSGYIRGIMIYGGVKLFFDEFPIGSGASTYGSVLSKNSIIYDELGMSKMIFFDEMVGVYDSNFATIIGEFGLVGVMVYFFLIKRLIVYLKLKNSLYSKFIIGSILLLSFTQPVFMNSYQAIFFTLLIIFIAQNHSINRLEKQLK